MAIQTAEVSKQQAIALWQKLRQHFVNAAEVIEEIIETKAWDVLGYSSFTEAWEAQMGEVTLAVEVRPHVVYQMLTEGYDAYDIASAVRGIGPATAERLNEQRRNGVPARDASLAVVREHMRKRPSAAGYVHVEVGPIALRRYREIADKHDTTVETIAAEAIRSRFMELGNA